MKYYDWNDEKNNKLKKERHISFETILSHIEEGDILDKIQHQNKDKYPNQSIFIIENENYVYLVPFVEDEDKIFLKTIIPNRKGTSQYLRRKKDE